MSNKTLLLSDIDGDTPLKDIMALSEKYKPSLTRTRILEYVDYRNKIDPRPDMEPLSFVKWLESKTPSTNRDLDFAKAVCDRHYALSPPKNHY